MEVTIRLSRGTYGTMNDVSPAGAREEPSRVDLAVSALRQPGSRARPAEEA
jgi:hypothetical protein